ncbi:hypothetical protein ACQ3JU_1295 (plasmid) [Bradyrhizobium guangxiense]
MLFTAPIADACAVVVAFAVTTTAALAQKERDTCANTFCNIVSRSRRPPAAARSARKVNSRVIFKCECSSNSRDHRSPVGMFSNHLSSLIT